MSSRVVKATTRGQITLPIAFREQFDTSSFLITFGENKATIVPVELPKQEVPSDVNTYQISHTALSECWDAPEDSVWDNY